MRRAAVSVPASVAEGFKKRSIRDKMHFYNIAQSSLEELRYYVILSRDLGYIRDVEELRAHADEVARMLYGLLVSTSRRGESPGSRPGAAWARRTACRPCFRSTVFCLLS